MTIEELRAFITLCAERMGAIAGGLDETRSRFNEAEQAEWDTLDGWVGDARSQVERLETIQRAASFAGNVSPGFTPPNVNTRTGDAFDQNGISLFATPSELRGRAMTAIEQCEGASDESREAATQTLQRFGDNRGALARHYLATGSEMYRSAWAKRMSGRDYALTAEESDVLERAAGLTDADGGYAVPFLLDPTIILTNSGTNNPFRSISRIVKGTSDVWNGVTSAGVTASWDGEAVEVSDDAPTLGTAPITAHKASEFVPYSIEISQDWASLESDLGMMLIDAKDRLEGAAFATGSGTGQPVGIVTALVAGSRTTASSTSNAFVLADVYAVSEAIGPRFRKDASWVMSFPLLNDIRQFGTANNYNGFTVDLTAAGVSTILGKPVYESSDMDSTYGSGENYTVVFGDFKNYVIFDRIGMSVEYIPHVFGTPNNRPTGQRGLYASWRVGADSVNDNAFTVLNIT